MKNIKVYFLFLCLFKILIAMDEGMDLSDMIQDTIGLSESTNLGDTMKSLESKANKETSKITDTNERNKKTTQKTKQLDNPFMESKPDTGMDGPMNAFGMEGDIQNNMDSNIMQKDQMEQNMQKQQIEQNKKDNQEVVVEKTKMDLGEIAVNKDKLDEQNNKQINSDLKKLMNKFSENNNLMILNENIKIDTSHIDDMNQQIEKQIQANNDKNIDNKNIEERLRIEDQDVEQIQQDLAQENEKLGKSEQKREDLELQEESIENSKKGLEQIAEISKKTRKKLKESLDKNEGQKELIETENASLTRDITSLRTEKEKIVELVESERKRGEESRLELQDSQDKYEQLSEQIRTIRKQHDDMVQELETLNDQNKQAGLQLLQAQDEQTQYQNQQIHKQDSLKAVQLNLEFIRKMHNNIEQDHKLVDDQKRDQEDKQQTLEYTLKKMGSEQEMQKNEIVNKMEEYKISLQKEKKRLQEELEAELALEGKQKERIDKLRSIDSKLSNQRMFLNK